MNQMIPRKGQKSIGMIGKEFEVWHLGPAKPDQTYIKCKLNQL